LKIILFSPWYSWKIAELALNNNHSLTHSNHVMVFCKFTLVWYGTLLEKCFKNLWNQWTIENELIGNPRWLSSHDIVLYTPVRPHCVMNNQVIDADSVEYLLTYLLPYIIVRLQLNRINYEHFVHVLI
jgi:hypothetical protein